MNARKIGAQGNGTKYRLESNPPGIPAHRFAVRIKQAVTRGGAASIRIDDPNPDIELVETGLMGSDPGAGMFEIASQAERMTFSLAILISKASRRV